MGDHSPYSVKPALVGCAIGAALVAQQIAYRDPSGLFGWALFAAAIALIIFGVTPVAPTAPVLDPHARPAVRRIPLLVFGAATLAAIAVVTFLSRSNRSPLLCISLWALTPILGAIALGSVVASSPVQAPVSWSRREAIGFGAILLLAAAARALWIDSIPPAYFGDESRVGMFLRLAFKQTIPNFFSMGWNDWPVIGLSVQGMLAPLLGLRLDTLRLAAAVCGTLAVGTTYLLARELFTPATAIVAALLLAVCRTAINFSRLGVCHAQLMLYETFAFFWWWRAVNTGRATSYWWAGIGLGLCTLTYNAGDLVPLLWVGWLPLGVVFERGSLRRHWRGALITAGGFLAAAYPWIDHITDRLTFGARWVHWTGIARGRQAIGQVMDAWHATGASAALTLLWRQVWLTWLGVGVLPGAAYPELGYRGGGMLDHVTAPLFVLGLGVAVCGSFRYRGGFVAYWWMLTAVAGGVLTIRPPAFERQVGILPALAILAALPLDALIHSRGPRARMQGLYAPVLVAALVLGAGWDNWRTYFVRFAQAPTDETSALVHWVKGLSPDTEVFLVGAEEYLRFTQDVNNEIFGFEFPDRRLRDVAEANDLLPLHHAVRTPVAIVLGPSQLPLTSYIRSLYPHTEVAEARDGTGRPLFRTLRLQPQAVMQRAGLQQTVYDDEGRIVSTGIADPFDAGAGWTGGRVLSTGSVYWPTDKAVTLRVTAGAVQPDASMLLRFGDTLAWQLRPAFPRSRPPGPAAAAASLSVALPRGWHPVRVETSGVQGLSLAIPEVGQTLTRWDVRPEDTPEGLTVHYERDGVIIASGMETQLNAFATNYGAPRRRVEQPFVATWKGALRIGAAGTYELEALGSGLYSVEIDGQPLLQMAEEIPEAPRFTRVSRFFDAGLHPLVARWDSTKPAAHNRPIFQVFWTPPGGERELIPPSAWLRPAAAVPAKPTTASFLISTCIGDCDGDGMVSVDEVMTMVNIALGTAPPERCQAGNVGEGQQARVDQILTAAKNAMNGCGAILN